MAVLAVQDAVVSGFTEAFVAAAGGGDSFDNNGLCLFTVKNGGGGNITVTVDDVNSAAPAGASAFNADVAGVVNAGSEKTFGPFPPFRFNDGTGRVNVTYTGVVTVTVSVIRIRP